MYEINEEYIRGKRREIARHYRRHGRVSQDEAGLVMAGLTDVLEWVASVEGLDLGTQRHEVLETAAVAVEAEADFAVAFGLADAAPRGRKRREGLASRASATRDAAIEEARGRCGLAPAEMLMLYRAEVLRLGRDPELGLLTEREYTSVVDGESERRRIERKRQRLADDLANRQRDVQRQRRRRREKLSWAVFWAATTTAWVAAFVYLGWWYDSFPQGVFGSRPPLEQVVGHLVVAAVPGTLVASVIVVGVGLQAASRGEDGRDAKLPAAYSAPALAFFLIAFCVVVSAGVLFPWHVLVGLVLLPVPGLSIAWILRP